MSIYEKRWLLSIHIKENLICSKDQIKTKNLETVKEEEEAVTGMWQPEEECSHPSAQALIQIHQ